MRWLLTVGLFMAISTMAQDTIRTVTGDTPAAAQANLDEAVVQLLAAGGGLVVLPPDASPALRLPETSQTDRNGPGVTVLDLRNGMVHYRVPSMGALQTSHWAGMRVDRMLNLTPQGRQLPFQGVHAAQGIQNYVVSGSSSYMATLSAPVVASADQRLYVDLIRGIYVGQYLTITSSELGYGAPYDRILVKSIGWDADQRRHYFTADLKYPHAAGVLVYNKHVVNGLSIDGYSNADNQSMELCVRRESYGVGDSFVVSATQEYMSDVFSGFGDEGAVVLNAETVGMLDGFHSTVEKVDWEQQALKFAPGVSNAHTLAPSRPLINMNREKWVQRGTVRIVPPNKPYQGEAYEGSIGGPGNAFFYQGGAIIGSPDCGWTQDVVGRFFALLEPTEVIQPDDRSTAGGFARLPARPVYRWYQVVALETTALGEPRLRILRVRWSATAAGAPKLFLDENYTWDDHERPLAYAIAPGAWVSDIGKAWADVAANGGDVPASAPRTLNLAPSPDAGTAFDFAPGDPVEQAIGPDPWHPQPLRIRTYDQMPSTMDSPTIGVQNHGRVQTQTGLEIYGITQAREDLANRKDGKPSYHTLVNLRSLADVGVNFSAEVLESAVCFRQPKGRPQPIAWQRDDGAATTITVPATGPERGDLQLAGGHLDIGAASLKRAAGISATATAARNLRGIGVAVPAAANRLRIVFPTSEPDPDYSLTVQANWFTRDRVVNKTPQGFDVEFQDAAPDGAAIDWQLLR